MIKEIRERLEVGLFSCHDIDWPKGWTPDDDIEYLLTLCETQQTAIDEAREILQDFYDMMSEGLVVRNIAEDHKPDFAIKAMEFVLRLKKGNEWLTKHKEK